MRKLQKAPTVILDARLGPVEQKKQRVKLTLRFLSLLQNSSGTRVNRLKLKLICIKLLKSFKAPPPFSDCN